MVPFQNAINLNQRSMRSYTVEEHVSAVSEIIRYRKTNRETNIMLLCYKDIEQLLKQSNNGNFFNDLHTVEDFMYKNINQKNLK